MARPRVSAAPAAPSRSSRSSSSEPGADLQSLWSITVMSGVVASTPTVRQIGGPTNPIDVVELDVRTVQFAPVGADRMIRSGVAVVGPSTLIGDVSEGDHVLILGSTRRRFFRSGPATVARLEVEAHRVVRSTNRKLWAQVLSEVEEWMAAVGALPPPGHRKAA
jgi:hypothetical protein